METYVEAMTALKAGNHSYPCRCSRNAIAAAQIVDPASEPIYPGTCRDDPKAGIQPHALRFRIDENAAVVEFADAFQGPVRQDCRREAGDFVIQRRDGPFAYHLAVVVDDELQGVTEVVRGADLLSSTPRQILLQRSLGYRTPRYGHLPLLTEMDGRKLAKSRRAVPLEAGDGPRQLWQVLNWLEQAPPAALSGAPVREIWGWAIANWRPERLEGRLERRLEPRLKR
jgi:glutamyl-Q tRNA(Asp) synthetase